MGWMHNLLSRVRERDDRDDERHEAFRQYMKKTEETQEEAKRIISAQDPFEELLRAVRGDGDDRKPGA